MSYLTEHLAAMDALDELSLATGAMTDYAVANPTLVTPAERDLVSTLHVMVMSTLESMRQDAAAEVTP